MLLFKLLIVILLAFIVISLFTALYFLMRDPDSSPAVVKSLSVRIGLSLLLLSMILLGAETGIIQPDGFGE